VTPRPGEPQSSSAVEKLDAQFKFIKACYLDYLSPRAPGITREEWSEKMKAETWFTAQEALEWGLVTEIR
jgi:ATP-dependent protease ClpP protease subunit